MAKTLGGMAAMPFASRLEHPKALPGFEHIERYWDPHAGTFAAKIRPGEFYVTDCGEMIVTVLGSCVSACIRCRVTGIGGMNHFMLPHGPAEGGEERGSKGNSAATCYGNYAMERLINELLKHGAQRKTLEVKLVGGGRILRTMDDIGRRNIAFVREYLRAEQLRLAGEHLGGVHPRKVYYHPESGRVRLKALRSLHSTRVYDREALYERQLQLEAVRGEVELF